MAASVPVRQHQPLGPEPVLLSRKQVDALYDTTEAVVKALRQLNVEFIVTGGSLLGCVRQHSILFCDDDVDVSVLDTGNGEYALVQEKLQGLLRADMYQYKIKPWEAGDRVRSKANSSVFVDIFCIRKYETKDEMMKVIGWKKNGQRQSDEYVQAILDKMEGCCRSVSTAGPNRHRPLFPCWHFDTRKAIELWPKEVYRDDELWPLDKTFKMGPLTGIPGPRTPVLLLKRAFGEDCFDVYYQSRSHADNAKVGTANHGNDEGTKRMPTLTTTDKERKATTKLKPLVQAGGTWEGGQKVPLDDHLYRPVMPTSKAKRRWTGHGQAQLQEYLRTQSDREFEMLRPDRTVYMDGVFDLFHVGHLNAIRQCAELGNRVIIGVTGDEDASSYKRLPVINQQQRTAIVAALSYVDQTVCPCPLVVTEEFMQRHKIDLVVHGFINDADAERQFEFFELPIRTGRFQRIDYYGGISTTDIMNRIVQDAKRTKDQT